MSKMFAGLCFASLAILVSSATAQWCPRYDYVPYTAYGSYPKNIESTVGLFRAKLGGEDNGNAQGPLKKGHRSINWDAGIVPFDMPGDFFKTTVTRGAQFNTYGNSFAVSNPPPAGWPLFVDNRFSSFNKKFPTLFRTFSPERLFTSVKSNRLVASFSIPARNRRALVSGFGAVFTNVVKPKTSTLTFYDKQGCVIAKLAAPSAAKGLSFAGIIVIGKWGRPLPAVAKVRVKLGNAAITSPWKAWKNFVVLDDLIYGEPQKW